MTARLLTSAAAVAVLLTGISTASLAQEPNAPNQTPSRSTDQQMRSRDQAPGYQSYQQPTDQSSPTRARKSSKSTSSMKDQSSMSGGGSSTMNKQTAQGHKLDNIADKLNACGALPAAERQSCIDQATRM
jgi:hypothetical protein